MKPRCLNAGHDHLSWIENGDEPTRLEEWLPDAHLFVFRVTDDDFADIIKFLSTGIASEGYFTQQKKELVVRATDFTVIVGHLYKMASDEILRRYVLEYEWPSILTKAHGGVVG